MLKALIFDMDGTLLDSVELHAQAWAETFAHFGYSIPAEDVRVQIGKGGDQLLPVFLSEDDIQQKGKEIEKFRGDLFKREYRPKVKPFEGVRALFEKLRADDYKVGLASSSKGDDLEYYKKLVKIDDLLHVETSSEDAEKSKPHPDIFEAALKQLGPSVKPEEVLVVGDTVYDVEAAKKIGIRSIGVLCGGFDEKSLREAGAIAIFSDPSDLLARYDQIPLR